MDRKSRLDDQNHPDSVRVASCGQKRALQVAVLIEDIKERYSNMAMLSASYVLKDQHLNRFPSSLFLKRWNSELRSELSVEQVQDLGRGCYLCNFSYPALSHSLILSSSQ